MNNDTTPREEVISPDVLEKLAKEMVNRANQRQVALRVVGSIAVRLRCQSFMSNFVPSIRTYHDIDLCGLRKDTSALRKLLQECGWILHPEISVITENRRMYFVKENSNLRLDVFLDEIVGCHLIDLRSRLCIEDTTITPTDLLMSKLQRVKMRDADIQDSLCILAQFELFERDINAINYSFMSSLLSQDWGMWYTFISNLKNLRIYLERLMLNRNDLLALVRGRIDALNSEFQNTPKSLSWKLRSILGSRIRWYDDVEEVFGY